jgi:hypothetical protein
MRNLVGYEFETYDYKNKVFKQISTELRNDPRKMTKFSSLIEDLDLDHSGKVDPHDIKYALS